MSSAVRARLASLKLFCVFSSVYLTKLVAAVQRVSGHEIATRRGRGARDQPDAGRKGWKRVIKRRNHLQRVAVDLLLNVVLFILVNKLLDSLAHGLRREDMQARAAFEVLANQVLHTAGV